jgi:hypothetical protein
VRCRRISCDPSLIAFRHCRQGKRKPSDLPRFKSFPLLNANAQRPR